MLPSTSTNVSQYIFFLFLLISLSIFLLLYKKDNFFHKIFPPFPYPPQKKQIFSFLNYFPSFPSPPQKICPSLNIVLIFLLHFLLSCKKISKYFFPCPSPLTKSLSKTKYFPPFLLFIKYFTSPNIFPLFLRLRKKIFPFARSKG